jgi:hypothetical protein
MLVARAFFDELGWASGRCPNRVLRCCSRSSANATSQILCSPLIELVRHRLCPFEQVCRSDVYCSAALPVPSLTSCRNIPITLNDRRSMSSIKRDVKKKAPP